MNPDDTMEKQLRRLCYETSAERRQATLRHVLDAMDQDQERTPAPSRPPVGRVTMKIRTMKLALAAAVLLIVLGGVTFWPFDSSGQGQWWKGPAAAWSQEILGYLDSITAVVYRQRVGFVSDYGRPEMSQGWERRYNATDRYRRDRYDDGVNIMNTQWVVPDGDDIRMVEVSYQYECWFERPSEAYGFVEDFMERLRRDVGRLDKADRVFLDVEEFEGRQCVGFEISAAKYGDNPKGRFDRIWFDVETKLPARIERHGVPFDFDAGRTGVIIHDQFDYHADVPADLFLPAIPDGYVNAHPDEIREAIDAEAKGEMVFADVPEGLEEKIVAALNDAEAGSYRQGREYIFFTNDAWRKDYYSASGDMLLAINWYIPGDQSADGPFEAQDGSVLTETRAELAQPTLEVTEHKEQSAPRHPMKRILFLAGLIDRADRFHEHAIIDGVDCFGFEISAKKYGDNPDDMIHRLWFDTETYLPVRMEFESLSESSGRTAIIAKDQFNWVPDLSEDFFVPELLPIPAP
jgi:hypothetical protein